MSIIFSRQCEYALQAVLYLALQSKNQLTSIKDLTSKLDIPYHFVAKILQDLTRKGLLVSHKGPSGGFCLNKLADDITILEIIEAIDGTAFMENCIFGFPECDPSTPCAVHNQWKIIRENIYKMLSSKSILEMAEATKKSQFLIK